MKEQFMDSLVTVTGIVWPLGLLAVIAFIIATPWLREYFGRVVVNLMTKRRLNKDDYHLIRNVSLPTEESCIQIDHVIVSIYGIFVVETMNMRGSIYGSPHNTTWTQQNHHQTYKFQNPLRQNNENVSHLARLLNLSGRQIHSLVAFIGNSTFKTEMPENVTHGLDYIRYIESKTERVLSGHEVQEIIEMIESGRLANSFSTDWQHIRHV